MIDTIAGLHGAGQRRRNSCCRELRQVVEVCVAGLSSVKDFKSGAKVNPVMSAMAGGLEDQDMEDLAAYFASVK